MTFTRTCRTIIVRDNNSTERFVIDVILSLPYQSYKAFRFLDPPISEAYVYRTFLCSDI